VIAGICGALLLTIILIAIIACRLTRKDERKEAKYITAPPPPDPHLYNGHTDGHNSVVSSANGVSSNGKPTKEWYV